MAEAETVLATSQPVPVVTGAPDAVHLRGVLAEMVETVVKIRTAMVVPAGMEAGAAPKVETVERAVVVESATALERAEMAAVVGQAEMVPLEFQVAPAEPAGRVVLAVRRILLAAQPPMEVTGATLAEAAMVQPATTRMERAELAVHRALHSTRPVSPVHRELVAAEATVLAPASEGLVVLAGLRFRIQVVAWLHRAVMVATAETVLAAAPVGWAVPADLATAQTGCRPAHLGRTAHRNAGSRFCSITSLTLGIAACFTSQPSRA